MKRKNKASRASGSRSGLQGKKIDIEIESLSNTGDGVGRLDNRVVFVPFTMPGDRLRVTVTADKRTFLLAEISELLAPSTDRIDPDCEYFQHCGGCAWQHIPYHYQLKVKAEHVADALERIGGIVDAPFAPIVPSVTDYHYRNRIQGTVRDGKFFQHRKSSQQLIAIASCLIADEKINNAIAERVPVMSPGKVEIAVVDEEIRLLPMIDRSTELGFRQVNSAVNTLLANLVLSLISKSQCKNVYDLYCGRGGWTNQIARENPALTVTGIDSARVNIEAATRSATELELSNVGYIQAKVEESLGVVGEKFTLYIVDPPRSGLDPLVTRALCKKRADDLIYVSCHPATLARDLKLLTEAAYRLELVQPFDMFPQTSHVECLVYLRSTARRSSQPSV